MKENTTQDSSRKEALQKEPSLKIIEEFWNTATLFDPQTHQPIPTATLTSGYLKIHRQTPHETSYTPKSPEESYFVSLTKKEKTESSGKPELWVDDPDHNVSLPLAQFITHYHQNLKPAGWTLAMSPLLTFQDSKDNAHIRARRLLVDLEAAPDTIPSILQTLALRNQRNPAFQFPLHGFFVQSSKNHIHYYSTYCVPDTDTGKTMIASHLGSLLLLNTTDNPFLVVDSRSVGHTLRSLRIEHPFPHNDYHELTALRLTDSLLKPEQPVPIPISATNTHLNISQ